MKLYFSQRNISCSPAEADFAPAAPKDSLRDSIEKTRQALQSAYTGFDNALETDLIDSYIYEINSLQKRYKHLRSLAALETETGKDGKDALYKHSPVRALIGHVLG